MMQQQTPQPPPPFPYVDTFNLTLGPYGVMFTFGAGSVVDPRTQQQSIQTASQIGMSHELLKAVAFLTYREALAYEARSGVVIPVPATVIISLLHPFPQAPNTPPPQPAVVEAWLKSMEPLALKEWAAFWQVKKDPPQAVNPNGASEAALSAPVQG